MRVTANDSYGRDDKPVVSQSVNHTLDELTTKKNEQTSSVIHPSSSPPRSLWVFP